MCPMAPLEDVIDADGLQDGYCVKMPINNEFAINGAKLESRRIAILAY